ncbi:MAG TPA: response regulator [Anaerolineae bacterium]|nr:response regulator [Anaerolineae bacterium]
MSTNLVAMPEMDGFEVCRRLRRMPEGKNVPVLMLSAQGQVQDKVTGLRAGANDYIVKPIDPQELIARIEAFLRVTPTGAGLVFSVVGCKGGVGTTTVAINLALALQRYAQQTDRKVLLLDYGLPLGDIGALLNVLHPRSVADVLAYLEQLNPRDDAAELDSEALSAVLVPHSSGVQVLLGPPSLELSERLAACNPMHIVNGARLLADFVVLDAGVFRGESTLIGIERSDRILLVLTPDLACLRRARTAWEIMQKRPGVPNKVVLVLNRASSPGALDRRQVNRLLPVPVRFEIPDDPKRIVPAANKGIPVLLDAPRSGPARAISDLVTALVQVVDEKP